MAYAALVSLAQTIHKLLHDQYRDRYPVFLHDELQNITSSQEHIIVLQGFLEEFPERARSFEERIRVVANETEDILEDLMLEHHRRFYTSEWLAAQEGVLVRLLSSGDFKKFKDLMKEIGSVTQEVTKIKNRDATKDVQLSDSSFVATSLSSSGLIASTDKDLMVGFEDHLIEIKARLCGESSKLQVIPIFGMGGIGKTSLARNAYEDPLIVEYFDVRAWATVSQDHSEQQILSTLVVSIKAFEAREQGDKSLAEVVYKSLKSRRYLIVMDDIWTTKAWDDVRKIFPDDSNGSRIMLTTRLSDVAAYPDSSSPLHEMPFMDADQSWKLLRQKVFPLGNCPAELEGIGKVIARSCRGLPLAIVVISGLLSTVSHTPASWENIARNVREAVSRNDEKFAEKILSLSYNHLPHHLRPCFLYLGSFPEDYEISISKLIKLWVAEGFSKPSESKSSEETAEEYLKDLVKRSLVLVTKRKSNTRIKCCSIHDLVRDLCINKAEEEKFFLHMKDKYTYSVLQKCLNHQRRISIPHSNLNCLEIVYGTRVRTVLCFMRSESYSWGFLSNVRLLRVLDVVNANVSSFEQCCPLPSPVFELSHLTCLSIDFPCTEIPAAISNLVNLQTLIIHPKKASWSTFPSSTVILPMEIWRMRQLRHLISFCFGPLPDPDGETCALENLQTLLDVKNFKCTQEILQMIPNLKKLGISYFERKYVADCHLEKFLCLGQLEKLKLKIHRQLPFPQNLNLVFPGTLKKLVLSGCRLPWEDMTIIGSLPSLEVLKLRDYAFDDYRWETREGEFCQLKFLLIEGSSLKLWITESSHFPSLKCLVIRDCWDLLQIPDDIGEILALELIEVDDWPESLWLSAKRIQEEQQENWGPVLFKFVGCIIINRLGNM